MIRTSCTLVHCYKWNQYVVQWRASESAGYTAQVRGVFRFLFQVKALDTYTDAQYSSWLLDRITITGDTFKTLGTWYMHNVQLMSIKITPGPRVSIQGIEFGGQSSWRRSEYSGLNFHICPYICPLPYLDHNNAIVDLFRHLGGSEYLMNFGMLDNHLDWTYILYWTWTVVFSLSFQTDCTRHTVTEGTKAVLSKFCKQPVIIFAFKFQLSY